MRGGFDPVWSWSGSDLPKSNVFTDNHVISHVVLEDYADLPAQVVDVVLAQVHAIQQDAPAGRIVEPRQKLDQGRLAGAILADQRNFFLRIQPEVNVLHDHAVESPDRRNPRGGIRTPRGWAGAPESHPDCDRIAGCISKNSNRSFRNMACSEMSLKLERMLSMYDPRARESAGQESESADRDSARQSRDQHHHIGAVIAPGRDQVQADADDRAPNGNRLIFLIDSL